MELVTKRRSREHWLVLLVALAAPVGLLLLGLVLHPDPRGYGTHEQLGFQPCLPMRLWNVPCPGCGVTTAVTLALHGDALASLRTQPFGLVTIVTAAAFAAWVVSQHLRGHDAYAELQQLAWKRIGIAVGSVALVSWLYKLASVRGWLA